MKPDPTFRALEVTVPDPFREDTGDLPDCYLRVFKLLALGAALGGQYVMDLTSIGRRAGVDERTVFQAVCALSARGLVRAQWADSRAARVSRLWRRIRPWLRPRRCFRVLCGVVAGVLYRYREWRSSTRW